LVLIFAQAFAGAARSQSFDYADRPPNRDESREEQPHGRYSNEVSSYEDSWREIPAFPTEARSYATETLTLDAIGLLHVPFGLAHPAALLPGAGIYLLGAPIVHLAHARPLPALASFGLRATVPLGMAFAFSTADDCPREAPVCVPVYALTGLALGMVVASSVDAVFLANEEVPISPKRGAVIAPWVNATQNGASGGISGSF
jgi:hypothetical protein